MEDHWPDDEPISGIFADIWDRFEDVWAGGDRPVIDKYLAMLPEVRSEDDVRELLLGLIPIDLEWRWRRASEQSGNEAKPAATIDGPESNGGSDEELPGRPRLQHYLARYPQLGSGADLPEDLICREYGTRHCYGDQPDHAEYERDYGNHHPNLHKLLSEQDRELGHGELLPGDKVGPYKILTKTGYGGFGDVYDAQQMRPIQRRVALKLIKAGMDTKQVIVRFEAERQALAIMDHPNIAKVFDAGATETGRLYFVMELVQGVPVTDYCDRHKLTIDQRLELFIPICHAIQHAHQKGIIHRDIKPSNVLVAVRDDHPVPKVIDFGIAKATAQPLTEQSVFTEQGQMIGTPAYMSPEQAEMTGLDIDTRSDVYSLGVLLYELLSGSTPFDKKALSAAGFPGMVRIIREEDPPRPSTKIAKLVDDTAKIAKKRQVLPDTLCRRLRGDLDWIVMKTLEKDRTRRYASALDLAEDIERYTKHEPVEAGPPGMGYRLKKLARKHRLSLSIGAVIAALLVIGTVVSSYFAIEAYYTAGQLKSALTVADENAERAQESEQAARRSESDAVESASQSRRALAGMYVANGRRLMDADDLFGSLPWFAEALQIDSEDEEREEIHRWRIGSILGQCPVLTQMFFHDSPIADAVFDAKGRYVAVALNDGSICVESVQDGKRLRSFPAGTSGPRPFTFCCGGDSIAIATAGGKIQVWDVTTGNSPSREFGSGAPVRLMVSDETGAKVATLTHEGRVQVWDAMSGQLLGELRQSLQYGEMSFMKFTSGGERVAHVYGSMLQSWPIASSMIPRSGFVQTGFPIVDVCSSPDNKFIAAVGHDDSGRGQASIWDIEKGTLVTDSISYNNAFVQATFSPKATCLLTRTSGDRRQPWGTIKVWDVPSGTQINREQSTALWAVGTASYPAPGRIAVCQNVGTVEIWCPTSSRALRLHIPANLSINDACFTTDGKSLATAGTNGEVHVWNVSSGNCEQGPFFHDGCVLRCAYSADNEHLITVSDSENEDVNTVTIWDVRRGQKTLEAQHDSEAGGPILSPDGRHLATVKDGVVIAWDITFDSSQAKSVSRSLPCPNGSISQMVFSPDSGRLAVARLNRHSEQMHAHTEGGSSVAIWDTSDGHQLGKTLNLTSRVDFLRFCGDYRRLVIISRNSARIWDIDAASASSPLIVNDEAIQVALPDADGRWLATAADNQVRLWDLTTGFPITPALQHRVRVRQLSLSPDGESLVTYAYDTPRLRQVPSRPKVIYEPIESGGEVIDVPKLVWETNLRQQRYHRPSELSSYVAAEFSPLDSGGEQASGRIDRERATFDADARLAISRSRTTARVWDVVTGESVTPALRHSDEVLGASLSRDGRFALTFGSDSTIRVWGLGCTRPSGSQPNVAASMQWMAATDLALLQSGCERRTWNLQHDNRPKEDIIRYAELLSGTRMSKAQCTCPLTQKESREHWWLLRSKYPTDFASPTDFSVDRIAWHEADEVNTPTTRFPDPPLEYYESSPFTSSDDEKKGTPVKSVPIRERSPDKSDARLVSPELNVDEDEKPLTIIMVDTADPVVVDTTTSYHVLIRNDGDTLAKGLDITLLIPPGMDFVGVRGPRAVVAKSISPDERTVELARIGSLPANESVGPFFIDVRGKAIGNHVVKVRVNSSLSTDPIEAEEDTTVETRAHELTPTLVP